MRHFAPSMAGSADGGAFALIRPDFIARRVIVRVAVELL
jgi:hypothetical protein